MMGYLFATGLLLLCAAGVIWRLRERRLMRDRRAKKLRRREEKEASRRQKHEDDVNRPTKVIESGRLEPKVRRGRPSLVLLVEDSPTMMLALRKILERWNYKVVTAVDGRHAWSELQKAKPDIVVSDIDMPELNGIELLKLMRSDLVLMDVPVILITGNPAFHLQAGHEAGVSGLLAKPFEDRALIDQIRYLLQE